MTQQETYESLRALMAGKPQIDMDNSGVSLRRSEEIIQLELMGQPIADFHSGGDIQLFAKTGLTKRVLDTWAQYIEGIRIVQRNRVALINGSGFQDGIWLRVNGFTDGSISAQMLKGLDTQINAYAANFSHHLYESPPPVQMESHLTLLSSCRECEDPLDNSTEHLLEHMTKRIYPLSLMDRALDSKVITPKRVFSEFAQQWREGTYKQHSSTKTIAYDSLCRCLRKRLGLLY